MGICRFSHALVPDVEVWVHSASGLVATVWLPWLPPARLTRVIAAHVKPLTNARRQLDARFRLTPACNRFDARRRSAAPSLRLTLLPIRSSMAQSRSTRA